MDTDRVDPAEVDLDVFCDERFSEPRTGCIFDILLLGRMSRPPRVAGETEPAATPARPTVVRLSPDSRVDFPTMNEAERFLAAIAEVCDRFGITFGWEREKKTS